MWVVFATIVENLRTRSRKDVSERNHLVFIKSSILPFEIYFLQRMVISCNVEFSSEISFNSDFNLGWAKLEVISRQIWFRDRRGSLQTCVVRPFGKNLCTKREKWAVKILKPCLKAAPIRRHLLAPPGSALHGLGTLLNFIKHFSTIKFSSKQWYNLSIWKLLKSCTIKKTF